MKPRLHPATIRKTVVLFVLLCTAAFVASPTVAFAKGAKGSKRSPSTVSDLFASPTPFAIGHRGYGANDGEDPTRPLANTLKAFRRAFKEGIRIVELDLQRTADGKIVVFHDDYLSDFTCVSSLTHRQLLERRPEVPLFSKVLNSSRHFSKKGPSSKYFSKKGHSSRHSSKQEPLSGLFLAEIKVPIPLCDGANTSEQAAVSEAELVAAVVADIRRARMEDQVILNSGSPSILKQAAIQAPEIKRALSLNALQLLTPEEASAALGGLPVVKIPKDDCGLDWYNIDVIARLPAMPGADGNQRFGSFLNVALGCTGSEAVSLDKLALGSNPAVAQALIGAVHGVGLKAIVWTIENESEWDFVAAAGTDGITTNDIPLGLAKQAALPALLAAEEFGQTLPTAVVEGWGPSGAVSPQALALYPSKLGSSASGALRVEFALPDAGPARVAVWDIAGRQIESRNIGWLGPGRHELTVGRGLPSGVYLVRLTNGREQALLKATVLR